MALLSRSTTSALLVLGGLTVAGCLHDDDSSGTSGTGPGGGTGGGTVPAEVRNCFSTNPVKLTGGYTSLSFGWTVGVDRRVAVDPDLFDASGAGTDELEERREQVKLADWKAPRVSITSGEPDRYGTETIRCWDLVYESGLISIEGRKCKLRMTGKICYGHWGQPDAYCKAVGGAWTMKCGYNDDGTEGPSMSPAGTGSWDFE